MAGVTTAGGAASVAIASTVSALPPGGSIGWAHVAIALVLPTVSFALYLAMMVLFARDLIVRRRRGVRGPALSARDAPPPRVTIFKPLSGCDEDLAQNLESFARIDYPSFEILLGVADLRDPALTLARRFVAEHPGLDARVVVTDPQATINPKVAQLVDLERIAKGDIYVISDSNVRVSPRYLWSLVSVLGDERVGMV